MTKNNLEDLDLKFIENRTGVVKNIKWEEGYDTIKDTPKEEYLKALASAQNEALKLIEKERNEAYDKIKQMEQLLVNAEQALHIQKQINVKVITESNERINILVTENKEMTAKMKYMFDTR
jgi:hypothetical protein